MISALVVIAVCVPAWLAIVGGVAWAFFKAEGPGAALLIIIGFVVISVMVGKPVYDREMERD